LLTTLLAALAALLILLAALILVVLVHGVLLCKGLSTVEGNARPAPRFPYNSTSPASASVKLERAARCLRRATPQADSVSDAE
jgi:hypothetical protein